MAIQGCDYSFARPSPSALYAAGKRFVCRYLAYSHAAAGAEGKFLTSSEAAALHAAGLAIVANFESTADRAATAGAAGGSADGTDARVAMEQLGFPAGCVCYVSVQDTSLATDQFPGVATYLTAFRTALGPNYRVGIYGGSMIRYYLSVHGFRGIPFWQTAALSWSGDVWDVTATIQQRGAGSIPGTDADTALVADYGQWAPPGAGASDMALSYYVTGGGGTFTVTVPGSQLFRLDDPSVRGDLAIGRVIPVAAQIKLAQPLDSHSGDRQSAVLFVGRDGLPAEAALLVDGTFADASAQEAALAKQLSDAQAAIQVAQARIAQAKAALG